MKKNRDQPADAAELRRRAEERLKRQRSEGGGQSTEVETARLVHELEVRQIELEMQNKELQQTRAQVDALLAQYTDLYEFAPTGYIILDREGSDPAGQLDRCTPVRRRALPCLWTGNSICSLPRATDAHSATSCRESLRARQKNPAK